MCQTRCDIHAEETETAPWRIVEPDVNAEPFPPITSLVREVQMERMVQQASLQPHSPFVVRPILDSVQSLCELLKMGLVALLILLS
jgi:hypothetical protein